MMELFIAMSFNKEENIRLNEAKLEEVLSFCKTIDEKMTAGNKIGKLTQRLVDMSLIKVGFENGEFTFVAGNFDFRRGRRNFGLVSDYLFDFVLEITNKINKEKKELEIQNGNKV